MGIWVETYREERAAQEDLVRQTAAYRAAQERYARARKASQELRDRKRAEIGAALEEPPC